MLRHVLILKTCFDVANIIFSYIMFKKPLDFITNNLCKSKSYTIYTVIIDHKPLILTEFGKENLAVRKTSKITLRSNFSHHNQSKVLLSFTFTNTFVNTSLDLIFYQEQSLFIDD